MALNVDNIHSLIVRQLETWLDTMPPTMRDKTIVGFADGCELTPRELVHHVRDNTELGEKFVEHAGALAYSAAIMKMAGD
jgi:hypothetical protein